MYQILPTAEDVFKFWQEKSWHFPRAKQGKQVKTSGFFHLSWIFRWFKLMTHCPSPKTLQLRSLGEGQIHQYCPNHFKSKTEVGFVAALRWIFDQPLLLYPCRCTRGSLCIFQVCPDCSKSRGASMRSILEHSDSCLLCSI